MIQLSSSIRSWRTVSRSVERFWSPSLLLLDELPVIEKTVTKDERPMDERLQHLPVEEYLRRFKGLTLNQFDECKAKTTERVGALIGPKPTRRAMRRDQGSLFTPLDSLAV